MSIAATPSRNRSSPATQQPKQKNLTPLVTKRRDETNKFGSHILSGRYGFADPVGPSCLFVLVRRHVAAPYITGSPMPKFRRTHKAIRERAHSGTGHTFRWTTVASAPAMHTRSYIGNVRKSSNKRGAAPLQFCAASRLHCLHQFTGYWAESHWALSTLPFVATFSSHVAYSS